MTDIEERFIAAVRAEHAACKAYEEAQEARRSSHTVEDETYEAFCAARSARRELELTMTDHATVTT